METEQIRTLRNIVKLRGTLAELEVKEGENKNGVAYISLKGAIRFGDSGVETKKFRTYVQAQNANGNDNKVYTNIKKWVDNAVPETENKMLATTVSLVGSLEANDYVSASNDLIESLEINAKFFNDFEANSEDPATVDVEGYIKSIQDEIRNDEPTGRKKVTIITTDFFRNAVIVKNIIVPAKLAEGFCSMFSEGDTAILYLSYILHKGESKPQKPGGIGRQRVTEGKDYLELVLVGAPPLESIEEPLEKSVVKVLLKERAQKLEEIKELGYQGQGSKAAESTPKTKKNTSKKSLTKAEIEDIDEDDIPF